MQSLDLTPTADLARRHDLLELRSEMERFDLGEPLIIDWHEELYISADHAAGWIYGPAELDPTRDRNGHTPIPRRSRRELDDVAGQDIPWQRVATAHEVPLSGPIRGLLPQLQHEPRPLTGSLARQLVGPVPPHPGLAFAITALDRMLGVATGALGSTVRSVGAAMDPIICGVIAPGDGPVDGEPALWYPITMWKW